MEATEFELFCEESGLLSDCLERDILEAHLVHGLTAAELAPRLALSTAEVEQVLGCGAIRLTVRGGAVGAWADLLEVMRGGKASDPPTAAVGFDKYHPGDPEHAQVIHTRAKVLTAYDLAYGERHWREASAVEHAHREQALQRQREARRERRQWARRGRSTLAEIGTLAGLTAREYEVLHLHADRGLEHPDIAETLGIAVRTVQTHLRNARQKILEESSRQAVRGAC